MRPGQAFGEAASALIILGALAKLLPAVAAVASLAYYVIGIQDKIRRRRLEKLADSPIDVLRRQIEEIRETQETRVVIAVALALGGGGFAIAIAVLFYGI